MFWSIEGVQGPVATGVSPTLSWSDLTSLGLQHGDTYNVTLEVIHPTDGSDSETTTLYMQNIAPYATINAGAESFDLVVGNDLSLSGNFPDWSGDPDNGPNSILSASWDVTPILSGFEESGWTINVPWNQLQSYGWVVGNSYVVTLSVDDGDKQGTDTITVNVMPPWVSVSIVRDGMRESLDSPSEHYGTLRVRRATPANGALTVGLAFPDGEGLATNGDDYVQISTSITFADGQSEREFTISVVNDTKVEGDETFVAAVMESPTGDYEADEYTAEATITDNDRWDWDTPSGTAINELRTKSVPGADYPWDHGYASLQLQATSDLTNHSIGVDMWGEFHNPGVVNTTTNRVEDTFNISFGFNSTFGAIYLDQIGSNRVSSSGVRKDDNLEGAIPFRYSINDAAHTATVIFDKIYVGVAGTSSVTPGIGLDIAPIGIGFTGQFNVTTSWGKEITLPVTAYTFKLKKFED